VLDVSHISSCWIAPIPKMSERDLLIDPAIYEKSSLDHQAGFRAVKIVNY